MNKRPYAFSKPLYALRKEKSITKKEVAALLHVSEEEYDDYEKGISDIDVIQLMTLAKLFDVSVDYMAGVTTIRRPYPTE